MKVKDLIKILQNTDPELPVRLYVDHGQCAMSCFDVNEAYIEGDAYMADVTDENTEHRVVLLEG